MADDLYVELDDKHERLFLEYVAAQDAAQQWTDRKEELAAELIDFMGQNNKATIGGRHVVTRVGSGTANVFSQSMFKAAHPDMYQEFVVPQNRRPFLRLANPAREDARTR